MEYKKHKIVLLPTTTNSDLGFYYMNGENFLGLQSKTGSYVEDRYCNYQHLYILSNDIINTGDYFIDDWNRLHECTGKNNYYIFYVGGQLRHDNCKKVIATTDKSLTITEFKQTNKKSKCYNIQQNIETTKLVKTQVPQIPEEFLQKYIEEYNNDCEVHEVEVGCVNCWSSGILLQMEVLQENPEDLENLKLIINSNNTINVKLVKTSWTREEVIKIAYDLLKATGSEIGAEMVKIPHNAHIVFSGIDVDKWLNKNL